MTETPRSPKPQFYRTKRFYWIVAGLIALTVTPTIIYYELSYNSVNGTHPELVTGYRQISFGTATFYITVHVWSWAGSINTQVTSPAFTLTVDNLPFGTQVVTSGSFQPNNYVTYTLAFKSTDSGVAQTVGASNSDYWLYKCPRTFPLVGITN